MTPEADRFISVFEIIPPYDHVEDIPVPDDMATALKEFLDPDDNDPDFVGVYTIERELIGIAQMIVERVFDPDTYIYQLGCCEK